MDGSIVALPSKTHSCQSSLERKEGTQQTCPLKYSCYRVLGTDNTIELLLRAILFFLTGCAFLCTALLHEPFITNMPNSCNASSSGNYQSKQAHHEVFQQFPRFYLYFPTYVNKSSARNLEANKRHPLSSSGYSAPHRTSVHSSNKDAQFSELAKHPPPAVENSGKLPTFITVA